MRSRLVTSRFENGIAVLTLDHPPANTYSYDLMRELDEAILTARMAYAADFVPPRCAAGAVGRIKRAVQSGLESSLSEGLALERELQQLLFQGDDAREGLGAHLAKRQPQFTGR